MLILNKGKKDYYDYLSGIYGIDKDIVYDRREFETMDGTSYTTSIDLRFFFDNTLFGVHNGLCGNYADQYRTTHKWTNEVYGRRRSFILEIGFYQYLFEVDRYIDDNGNVVIEPSLINKFDNRVHIGRSPITFFYYKNEPLRTSGYWLDNTFDKVKKEMEYAITKENKHIDNPILSNTWITGFIPANEVYNNIYNYLIASKEPNIVDNRNDIQKLESKGFDKKTSFRNPINKRRK